LLGTIIAPGGYGGCTQRILKHLPSCGILTCKEVVKLRLEGPQAEVKPRSRNAGNSVRMVTGTGQAAAARDHGLKPLSALRGARTGRARVRPGVGPQFRWFPP